MLIDYPAMPEERDIILQTTGRKAAKAEHALTKEDVLDLQDAVLDVPVPDNVLDYILTLVHSTRPDNELAGDYIRRYVEWGAGPRASQNLTRAAKGLALLRGNPGASVEEVRQAAKPVLRHRIIPNYNATGEGIDVERIIDHLLESV